MVKLITTCFMCVIGFASLALTTTPKAQVIEGQTSWMAGGQASILSTRTDGWDYGAYIDSVFNKRLDDCLQDAFSTYAMQDCYRRDHGSWEEILTEEYHLRLSNLSDPEGLREVQRAWVRYRDLKCAFTGSSLGTAGSIAGTSCAAEMARQRALEFISSNSCSLIEGCLW